jgi:hypothetical protein
MRELSTATLGPNYISSSRLDRASDVLAGENDYLNGVIAHQFHHLRDAISNRYKSQFTKSQVAPPFQTTRSTDISLGHFAQALDAFVALEAGWNGIESRGPSRESVMVAMHSCWHLVQAGVETPTPKMLSDGTLGVFWARGNSYAAIDFEEDGEHVWTVTDGKNFTSGTWQITEIAPKAIYAIAQDEEPTTR